MPDERQQIIDDVELEQSLHVVLSLGSEFRQCGGCGDKNGTFPTTQKKCRGVRTINVNSQRVKSVTRLGLTIPAFFARRKTILGFDGDRSL